MSFELFYKINGRFSAYQQNISVSKITAKKSVFQLLIKIHLKIKLKTNNTSSFKDKLKNNLFNICA